MASLTGMVSAAPPPMVKSLADTEAVQSAPKPRPSVTWTVPRLDSMVAPGGPEPRAALAGVVMDNGPLMTPVVTVHWPPLVPDGQLLPAAAEVTVLVRVVPPVSGLLMVTEYVMVAVSPGVRSPVQVSAGLA